VRPRSRKAPWWLWVAALAVLLPVSIAIGALFVRAIGASGTVADTLFTTRTLQLTARSFLLTALVTTSATIIGVAGA